MNGVFNRSSVKDPATGKVLRLHLRHLALPPRDEEVRVVRRGHQQPLGPGLQPPGRLVRLLLRDRPPVPHDPERLLHPPGRAVPAADADPAFDHHHAPRAGGLRRIVHLRRRRTARRVPRPARHGQPPRQSPSTRTCSPATAPPTPSTASPKKRTTPTRTPTAPTATAASTSSTPTTPGSCRSAPRSAPTAASTSWTGTTATTATRTPTATPPAWTARCGRIYRISYHDTPIFKPFDLQQDSTEALLKLLDHPNVWWRRTAQRILNEKFDPSMVPALEKMALDAPHENNGHMHALWLLVSQHALDEPFHLKALSSENAPTRNWARARRRRDGPGVAGRLRQAQVDGRRPLARRAGAGGGGGRPAHRRLRLARRPADPGGDAPDARQRQGPADPHASFTTTSAPWPRRAARRSSPSPRPTSRPRRSTATRSSAGSPPTSTPPPAAPRPRWSPTCARPCPATPTPSRRGPPSRPRSTP